MIFAFKTSSIIELINNHLLKGENKWMMILEKC